MNKDIVGEVTSISTYYEGKFTVEDIETLEEKTCMLVDMSEWDKLYDYLSSKRIHLTVICDGYLKDKHVYLCLIR